MRKNLSVEEIRQKVLPILQRNDVVRAGLLLMIFSKDIHAIQSFAGNMSQNDFYRSPRDQDAIVRRLMNIGEAASRIPDDFKGKYPNVPWRKMAGMRHHLVHGYDNIKLDVVWETIHENLPSLKQLERES